MRQFDNGESILKYPLEELREKPKESWLILNSEFERTFQKIFLTFKFYILNSPEHWLRGPVENIVPELQPAAHALLQAKDEINEMMIDFPENKLWEKVAGKASVGFHLQHIAGVQDRLFTYAENKQLSDQQMNELKSEGKENAELNAAILLQQLNAQFERSIQRLTSFTAEMVNEERKVGRKQLPSSVRGLLFHAAEHTMRHTGQLLVTIAVLKEQNNNSVF